MAKAKIPAWFDIKNYDRELTDADWAVNIDIRYRFLEAKTHLPLDQQITFLEAIGGEPIRGVFDVAPMHKNPFPVRTMNSADMAVISASWSSDDGWQELYNKVCSVVGKSAPPSFLSEMIEIYNSKESLKSDAIEKIGWLAPEFCHGVPITVDLDSDDETLKLAFSIWLAGARSELSNRFKKPFTQEDYQKWRKLQILAAFDLYQWSEINNLRLTNTQIANAIFPPHSTPIEDRDIDMSERLRKVVKPLMEHVITGWTVRLITSSVRLSNHLDEVVERAEVERGTIQSERKTIKTIPDLGFTESNPD